MPRDFTVWYLCGAALVVVLAVGVETLELCLELGATLAAEQLEATVAREQ